MKTKEQLKELIAWNEQLLAEDIKYWRLGFIIKTKTKLNHCKQLLRNIEDAEQLYKETENLFKKQEMKPGDKVRIKDGWLEEQPLLHTLLS
jgi:hypothetical protein